jgi:hypothetical protein
MTPTPLGVLLADLSARGIALRADGDRLRFRPRSAAPELVERLRTHKAELLGLLQGADGPAAEADAIIRHVRAAGDNDLADRLAEAWEERLSICTTDGGLTLAAAELVALEQLRHMLDSTTSNRYT